MKWLVLAMLAACGDNQVPVAADAAPHTDGTPAATCSVTMTGNVVESSQEDALCPRLLPAATMGHTMIRFVVASRVMATKIGINIDLGAQPTTGEYSSETATIWSALAIETTPVVDGACIFTAGAMSVPAGSFELRVDAIDLVAATAHGELSLLMFVLPRTTEQGVQTDCGAGTTESVVVTY
ncbi:MAG TPA: hypothetical protein VIV58_38900 [Kofleriaceae bacterium]